MAADVHYQEHVVNEGLADEISPEQYTRDALYFRDTYQGEWKKINLADGTVRYEATARNGQGGIYSEDWRIVSFWYR